MAAKVFYRKGFLLLMFNFISTTALDKKFSDLKRCADEECSMLLCRGKAVSDFSGPDCRFLSFKTSETIHVYYKLAGRRTDIWAGSVGSRFGYFPKDFLAVNHIYTENELEVSSEETDFVCFDRGFDKFDNYDIDSLLSAATLVEKSENANRPEAAEIAEETKYITEETTEKKKYINDSDGSQGLDIVLSDNSASMPQTVTTESQLTEAVKTDAEVTEPNLQTTPEFLENLQNFDLDKSKTKDAPTNPEVETQVKTLFKDYPTPESEHVSVSPGIQIPELKTTFGNTFDAVTTEDEETQKVTPYEGGESEDVKAHEDYQDTEKELLLLSSSEKVAELKTTFGNTIDAVTTEDEETQTITSYEGGESKDFTDHEDYQDTEKELLLGSSSEKVAELKTTYGNTFDAVITEDEDTQKVTPYEGGESKDFTDHEDYQGTQPEFILLSYPEKVANTQESDSLNKQETLPITHEKELKLEEELDEEKEDLEELDEEKEELEELDEEKEEFEDLDEMEFGEDEDDDDEEEVASEIQSTEEGKEKSIQLLSPDLSRDSQAEAFNYKDSTSSSLEAGDKDTNSETLLFDDENHGKSVDNGNVQDETSPVFADKHGPIKSKDDTTTRSMSASTDSVLVENTQHNEFEMNEHTKEEVPMDSEDKHNMLMQDNYPSKSNGDYLATITEENITTNLHEDVSIMDAESKMEKKLYNSEESHENKYIILNQSSEHSVADLEITNSKQSKTELSSKDTKLNEALLVEEKEDKPSEKAEEIEEEKEELLEDENAISFTQTSEDDIDTPPLETAKSTSEPEYSDSVLGLTLLRDHFKEENMVRLQKLLGLKNLYRVEGMFSDLDLELHSTRLAHVGTTEDMERALESIMEVSENTILDEIEKMMAGQEQKIGDAQQIDNSMLDEEAELLDDFQEFTFRLRQKYSTASDSTPLTDTESQIELDDHEEDALSNTIEKTLDSLTEEKNDSFIEKTGDDNLTVADMEERPLYQEEVQVVLDDVHKGPEISVEEDGGHFNRNEDNQPSYTTAEELQKPPQALLESPFEMGFVVEMEDPLSASLDSIEPVSDFHEEELGIFSTGILYSGCLLAMNNTKIREWVSMIISQLPEEWKPGETLFGCSWQAVIITALVGVLTLTLFFWKTVLAVKKREYLVDEKGLRNQIEALKKEKCEALSKMSELQQQTEELKEKQKESEKTTSSALKRNEDLESKVVAAEAQNERIAKEKSMYERLLEEEREHSQNNETRIEKLEKANEKLQLNRKKTQDALAKVTVLLDEAKIREDARNVHHKCLERDYALLKEKNKTFKTTIKEWEDKHKELMEQIKVYHKSQKELEDSVVLKDHNVELLSDLLADLDACDSQKGDGKVLANGEVATDKTAIIKNRIKQMMDVSRVQTTLVVVEEERDRFMTKLLNEEKARKALEEQHQELEHAIATLKSEKSHVENQRKILQQKNEIMTEMYQQKENALQQRLTKEELERRSKESLLSEVGGKAVEAEEQVRVLKQRIGEMEEQMKKTEEVYKEQIKEQENKTHSNWVTARNAERALNQEKVETSKLREKLTVLTSQLNERRAPLFRPNSGQPMGHRQGDSYGPSPVSVGAPSPPPMIEGPRRPPSAPVGRRMDPFGPRPPSDPHGRYPDNKHTSGMDTMAPRTSSPANMDGSTAAVDSETQAEASTESAEPGPGSFMSSPIRDSLSSMVHHGPHDLPPGPPGRLLPPGPHRPPRPGPGPLYHPPPPGMAGPHGSLPPGGPPLPANGHPGVLPPPGPMGGEFGPRPSNGHVLRPWPAADLRGPPPPPHFRPPPPHRFGPMPPPHGVLGPMGPCPPFAPDMRFPGPRYHAYPPAHMGGVPPQALHGGAYAQAAPEGPLIGPHSQGQEGAPQDSVGPAMTEP